MVRRRLERHELTWLIVGLAASAALFAFALLAGLVLKATRVRSTRAS